MACGAFTVPRVMGTCACCGTQVLFPVTHDYRRVHFIIQNGQGEEQSTWASCCSPCARHAWDAEDLAKLERQSHAMWMLERPVLSSLWNPLEIRFLRPESVPVQTWAEVL